MTDYVLGVPQEGDVVEGRDANDQPTWRGEVAGSLREPPRVLVVIDGDTTPKEIEKSLLQWDADGSDGVNGCWFVVEGS